MTPTVLVADDEFAALERLSAALEEQGHHVLKAGDGADALRILVSHPVDVVVTNDTMPVMTGHQLYEATRAEPRLAAVPVILMVDAGWTIPDDADGLIVLPKPVALAELVAAVERAVKAGSPRSRRPR